MQGWVPIHRQLNDNWLWKDKPFSKGQAWIDILLRVNHKPAKVPIGNQVIEVKEGQTIWSVKDMADKWGWSRKKVDNFLKVLQTELQITKKSTTKYTLLTVANWELYQAEEQQKNINGTSKEHQRNTNNNDNNNNNEKDKKNSAPEEHETFFENMWKQYPLKKGKSSISVTQKKKLYKLGDELQRCLDRYIAYVKSEDWLRYKNGSTFFNSGYVDYLDENYDNKQQKKTDNMYSGMRRV